MSKMHYVFVTLGLVALHFKLGVAISCLSCNWTPTAGEDDCFNYNSNSTTIPALSCPYQESDNPYCQTQFIYEDGIITSLSRKCQSGVFDEDLSQDTYPLDDVCVSSYTAATSDVSTVTCYLSCWNEVCNIKNPEELVLCNEPCGLYGSCDYITGNCTCQEGWTGTTCSTQIAPSAQTFRSCVQCDSESYAGCDQLRRPTSCANPALQFCAVTTTTTFAEDGSIKREFISRSCTETFQAADECYISKTSGNPPSTDVEYTCISTCDTDGCNIGTPNGKVDLEDEKYPLRCVVCDSNDLSSNCEYATQTSACASTDSYCLSTVTYYLSERTDTSFYTEPEYRLDRLVRSCASDFVAAACTTQFVQGSSLQRVTCQETCQEDGCNTGWPARPQCSNCACTNCASDDSCSINPPAPTSCPMPYQEYCVIQDSNRPIATSLAQYGYPRNLVRSCSHQNIGNICSPSTYSFNLESCNKTCSTFGCNLGYYANVISGSSTVRLSVLSCVTSCLFALTLLFAAEA